MCRREERQRKKEEKRERVRERIELVELSRAERVWGDQSKQNKGVRSGQVRENQTWALGLSFFLWCGISKMVNTKIISLPLLYHHHLLSLFLSHYPKYSYSSISNPNSPISFQTRHPPYSFRLPTTQFYFSLILFSLLRLSGFTPSLLSQGFRFLTLRGFCCAPKFIRYSIGLLLQF